MIKERLLVWFKKNDRQLPTRILLYRGGVSDGQFGMLKCEEVDQIKKGFDAAIDVLTQKHQFSHMFKGKTSLDLKVTVVSVVRHQHTRFYSMTETVKKNTRPGVHNAPPGLVIDSTIVSGDNFNFYLQSHTTPMGTSKSAHYTVIENGMDFSESELQKLVCGTVLIAEFRTMELTIYRHMIFALLIHKSFTERETLPVTVKETPKSKMACQPVCLPVMQNTYVTEHDATSGLLSFRSLTRKKLHPRSWMLTPMPERSGSRAVIWNAKILGKRTWMIRCFTCDLSRLKS